MATKRHTAVTMIFNSSTGPLVDLWYGYAVHETAGAAEEILFKDGTSTGLLLWPLEIAANGSEGIVFTTPITVPSGVLHIDSTGAIAGSVFV